MCVCVFFACVCYFPVLTCPWAPWHLDTLPMDEEAVAPEMDPITPSPLPPKTLDETPDKARLNMVFMSHVQCTACMSGIVQPSHP